jgi:ribosomal protein L7/L12
MVDRVLELFERFVVAYERRVELLSASAQSSVSASSTYTALRIRGGYESKHKIQFIKDVRELTGIGLKEAKNVVEGARPLIVKTKMVESISEAAARSALVILESLENNLPIVVW